MESPNAIMLGKFDLCLNVKDLAAAHEFYARLGFVQVGGNAAQGWLIVEQRGCRLGLYQGHIDSNLLNFRGGNVAEIQRELESRGLVMKTRAIKNADGCETAYVEDPDGNVIMFDTCRGETLD